MLFVEIFTLHTFWANPFCDSIYVYIYSDPPPANVMEGVVIAVESKTINMIMFEFKNTF